MPAALQRVLDTELVDTADIARVLKASPRSVQRWTARDVAPKKDSEERLLELGVVLNLAAEVMPEDGARLWLRTPVADLGWQKPLDVMGDGGFRQVIDALLALSQGVIQ